MAKFVDRVASEALALRPLKMLATVLAIPFYVLGLLLGLLVVVAAFAVGAVRVGIADARARLAPPASPALSADLDDVEAA